MELHKTMAINENKLKAFLARAALLSCRLQRKSDRCLAACFHRSGRRAQARGTSSRRRLRTRCQHRVDGKDAPEGRNLATAYVAMSCPQCVPRSCAHRRGLRARAECNGTRVGVAAHIEREMSVSESGPWSSRPRRVHWWPV